MRKWTLYTNHQKGLPEGETQARENWGLLIKEENSNLSSLAGILSWRSISLGEDVAEQYIRLCSEGKSHIKALRFVSTQNTIRRFWQKLGRIWHWNHYKDTILKLKGVGYTGGGLFALVTELGGSPIEVENLNDEMRERIIKLLASIHAQGLLHGDIRRENILIRYCHDGFNIMFIDFGFSRKISNRKESQKEMIALKVILRIRSVNCEQVSRVPRV